ncbi:MAG: YbfB/YjiJ family MFS transporter [Proteobacteria bacterium]|nr:YbfB/YjiJ family MFS transporter [Pseudomonadota bacterium]
MAHATALVHRPARPVRAALGGLVALAVGIGIGRFVYTPILPPMMAALGLSPFAAGLVASANFAGYLVGALLAAGGRLPGGQRAWLLGGLWASAITTAAMGLTRALPAFLALRFAGGAASAVVLILVSAVVLERLAEAGRSDLSALLFAGVGTGVAASAVLVSLLRAAGDGWAALWLASGGLSAVGALAAGWLVPAADARPPAAAARPLAGEPPPRDRRLLRLALAYGLFGFGYVITATFLVAIVRGDSALRPLEPVVWVVFGLAAAPSVALWTALARRTGIPAAFALAALTEALGVLASVTWPSRAGVFLAAVLVGGTFMGLTALGLVRGRELARGEARRVLALMTSAFGLGQILGPTFAGALSDRLGSFLVPSIVAAAALATAAVLARR